MLLIFFCVSFSTLLLSILLQSEFHYNSVFVSAGISFVSTFIFSNADIRNVIYVAAFCSMGVAFHSGSYLLHSILISLIISFFYKYLKSSFVGHGGKLGSIAYLGTLVYFLVGFYALR